VIPLVDVLMAARTRLVGILKRSFLVSSGCCKYRISRESRGK
jgi:hypothetical protein